MCWRHCFRKNLSLGGVIIFFKFFAETLKDVQTASGILYNCWDAHYRRLNVLRFTNDGCALISGSDDSSVNVWSVSRSIRPCLSPSYSADLTLDRLLDNELQNEHVLPFCSFSDHTLPVTDILCGIGLFPECRILTSSVDHSVKV